MITAQALTKYFDDFLAVDRVDLKVGAGEVLALLGPNGAGKTTTVRMLTSVLYPSSGKASVAGYDVLNQAQQVRASVGVLTENHGLYNRMPSQEYLEFYGNIYGMERLQRTKRAVSLLKDFGLEAYARQRIGKFSKGMRQKLALARALMHDPPVLLLDEPTSAMDPESARLVRDSIKALRSNDRAVVICTHNLAEAEELADRIAIIRQGRIIANGTPKGLKDTLLGPQMFEVRFGKPLDGIRPNLPDGIEIVEIGSQWLQFRSPNPGEHNPAVLRYLLEQGLSLLSLQEVTRSLEQVYLQAVLLNDEIEVDHIAKS